MRQKQNKYPILFLTQGVTDLYPEFMDIRCQSTKIAMSFAQSENILVRERWCDRTAVDTWEHSCEMARRDAQFGSIRKLCFLLQTIQNYEVKEI